MFLPSNSFEGSCTPRPAHPPTNQVTCTLHRIVDIMINTIKPLPAQTASVPCSDLEASPNPNMPVSSPPSDDETINNDNIIKNAVSTLSRSNAAPNLFIADPYLVAISIEGSFSFDLEEISLPFAIKGSSWRQESITGKYN